MAEQNYSNHTQIVTPFHKVLFPLAAITMIGSFVNLYKSLGDESRIYSASLIVAISIALVMLTLLARIFALKAQDRAIRAETNLRHYVLTGKLIDPRLEMLQVVALRFAPDSELPELAKKAADSNMQPKDIKMAIKTWRPDTYRV